MGQSVCDGMSIKRGENGFERISTLQKTRKNKRRRPLAGENIKFKQDEKGEEDQPPKLHHPDMNYCMPVMIPMILGISAVFSIERVAISSPLLLKCSTMIN